MTDPIKAVGGKTFFRTLLTPTPKILVGAGQRGRVVFTNESGGTIFLGGVSGSLTTANFGLPTLQQHEDEYSSDEWWGYVPTSSGTVSGYIVY